MRFMELETPRLRLRGFRLGDFDAAFAFMSDPETMKYRGGGHRSAEQVKAYLDYASFSAGEEPCQNFEYAAVLKSGGEVVGQGALFHCDAEPELG
jgi:RimJ/RimL family protein N-acetyltransferase